MAETEKELKDLSMKVKESAKAGGIDGEEVEAVTDFIFLGSKISSDGDYSHEIKRRLRLGRKAMASLDKLVKTKDITLSTKICIVRTMVFPVVTYGCESWTIKKAERRHYQYEIWRRCDETKFIWQEYDAILNPIWLSQSCHIMLKMFLKQAQGPHLGMPYPMCEGHTKAISIAGQVTEEVIRGYFLEVNEIRGSGKDS
ncbi:Hypothetical predicted protein [Pelobates cultripes]|uniref:Uncharacterized protein n=1 Tax=Pelobates cultripes TaxID=61616 RepID=A0AAD1TFR3_PELCU|nr:Hypothetical predicted protein [Pelobates cultripes]